MLLLCVFASVYVRINKLTPDICVCDSISYWGISQISIQKCLFKLLSKEIVEKSFNRNDHRFLELFFEEYVIINKNSISKDRSR